jgi:hypothetical protein
MARRRAASLRFLLEGVQNIDDASKLDRIDGPVSVAIEVLHHFQHARAAKTLERLCRLMFFSRLRREDRETYRFLDIVRHGRQVLFRGTDEFAGLFGARHRQDHRRVSIVKLL